MIFGLNFVIFHLFIINFTKKKITLIAIMDSNNLALSDSSSCDSDYEGPQYKDVKGLNN